VQTKIDQQTVHKLEC